MSFLLLGVLNSQAAGGAAETYELISSVDTTSSSVTFSSIPQTFRHLQVRSSLRVTGNLTSYFKANNSSATVSEVGFRGATSSTQRIYSDYSSGWYFQETASNEGSDSNIFASLTFTVFDYSQTDKWKPISLLGGVADNYLNVATARFGNYESTSAVSSITISLGSSAVSGTHFELYGLA